MFDLNPDIVCAVIRVAREFQAKEEVVLPDRPLSPAEDWALQVLADHVDDLSYQEGHALIDDLEPDQQVSLTALAWVGRGDFSVEEWEEALREAQEGYTENVADELLATPLIAGYLAEGLAEFGYDCGE